MPVSDHTEYPDDTDVYGPVFVMILLSNVTAPDRANNLPLSVAPVPSEMDDCAKIFPLKTEPVLRVAALPTCQKTLQALALLMRLTELLDAVVSVDAIWKIKTLLGLFWPSSVTFPVIAKDTGAL